MSQYATLADLTSQGLPEAALEGMTAQGIDPDEHLTAASARFDASARGRYRLPLTSPYPLEVISCVCSLAAYSILSVRGFDPQNGSDFNIRQRYEDAVMWLRDLSRGHINLDVSADATPDAHDGGPIVASRSTARSDSRWGTDC